MNGLSLKLKLLVIAGIPFIVAIIFSGLLLMNSIGLSNDASNTEVSMQLGVMNSSLVHELQKERGLTAGFLGANGDETFRQKLNSQRAKTDAVLKSKLALNKNLSDDLKRMGLAAINHKNTTTLNNLNSIRNSVSNMSITLPQAISYYTTLNGNLLEVISLISQQSQSAKVKQQGLAYYNFAQAKERAGIERAVNTTVFSKNNLSINQLKKFTELVIVQQTYLNEFKLNAAPQLVTLLKNSQGSTEFKKVYQYRDLINQLNIQGNFQVGANAWFDAASERINQLRIIEQAVAEHITSLSQIEKESAFSAFVFFLTATIMAVLVSVFIALKVMKGINKQVNSVIDVLSYSSKNNALDRSINLDGNDEISNIAKSINHLISNFRSTIGSMRHGSEQLAASSHQNSVTIIQTNQALKDQQSQTFQVATAMEEMTMTIGDVARNTTLTSEAAQQAEKFSSTSKGVVDQAIVQIEQVAEEVTNVYHMIDTLNQSSSEITSVIDVIKSVAEQTNLLALNAAIEAARAGEQGRGFSVVADEVRTLAQRTQESTSQIEQIIVQFATSTKKAFEVIESSQKLSQKSVHDAKQISDVIHEIQNSISTINQMAEQIATATEQQVKVADEIGQNVVQISSAADQSATASEEITNTSNDQAKLAQDLQSLSAQFTV